MNRNGRGRGRGNAAARHASANAARVPTCHADRVTYGAGVQFKRDAAHNAPAGTRPAHKGTHGGAAHRAKRFPLPGVVMLPPGAAPALPALTLLLDTHGGGVRVVTHPRADLLHRVADDLIRRVTATPAPRPVAAPAPAPRPDLPGILAGMLADAPARDAARMVRDAAAHRTTARTRTVRASFTLATGRGRSAFRAAAAYRLRRTMRRERGVRL